MAQFKLVLYVRDIEAFRLNNETFLRLCVYMFVSMKIMSISLHTTPKIGCHATRRDVGKTLGTLSRT